MNSYDQEKMIDGLRRAADALELIDARLSWFQRFLRAMFPDIVALPADETEAEHGD